MYSHDDQARETEAGRAETEVTILDAAERLLHRVALHDLTVARIISDAEISRATFYFYFDSKFGVLTALVARVLDRMAMVVEPLPDGEGTPQDAHELRRRVEDAIQVWSVNRPVLRAAAEHWPETPELRAIWLAMMERFTDAAAAQIDSARAAGAAPAGADSRQLAAALAWAIERALYIAGLEDVDALPSEGDLAESINRMWWGAIFGGEPAEPHLYSMSLSERTARA